MSELLTYRQAAARVGRSPLTIKRWRRRGLLVMGWELRDGQHVRVVEERALLACWRERLKADPVHQKRLLRLANGERHDALSTALESASLESSTPSFNSQDKDRISHPD